MYYLSVKIFKMPSVLSTTPQTGLTSTSTAASTDPKNICHASDLCNDKACKDRTATINITEAILWDH